MLKSSENGSGPREPKPVIADSTSISCGTHHICPKLRTSTKWISRPFISRKQTRVWRQIGFAFSYQRSWPVIRRCTTQRPHSLIKLLLQRFSSCAIRYLPRRRQSPTQAPIRDSRNNLGPPKLAIVRSCRTSISWILKLRSRCPNPRQIVSTSGSSGKLQVPQAASSSPSAKLLVFTPPSTPQ